MSLSMLRGMIEMHYYKCTRDYWTGCLPQSKRYWREWDPVCLLWQCSPSHHPQDWSAQQQPWGIHMTSHDVNEVTTCSHMAVMTLVTSPLPLYHWHGVSIYHKEVGHDSLCSRTLSVVRGECHNDRVFSIQGNNWCIVDVHQGNPESKIESHGITWYTSRIKDRVTWYHMIY